MIEQFTNQYSISKTLRFSLIPVGKTEENINAKHLLEQDIQRADDYQKVKGYIDLYHKYYIEKMLSAIDKIDGLDAYADLFYKPNKEDSDKAEMEGLELSMRKQIVKALTSNDEYKKLDKKEIITELLPSFLTDKEEIETVSKFAMFSTYFKGFFDNRKNMYSEEAQSTAISYRCINDNLPKFLDNCKSFAKVKENLSASDINSLNEDFCELFGNYITDIFNIDYYSFTLSQIGIDKYNQLLGGYTCSDGTKIKGLNEYINLYNQQVAGKDKSARLPFMKPLYKQILSDRDTVSFLPEKFNSDNELLNALKASYSELSSAFEGLKNLFTKFDSFNTNGIFITSGLAITDLSNAVFGSWSVISSAWNKEYDSTHKMGKNVEKYEEDRKKEYKKINSFSLAELQRLGTTTAENGCTTDISKYYTEAVAEKVDLIKNAYSVLSPVLDSDYEATASKKLCKNDDVIEQIKNLLDAIKDLERLVKPLNGTGKEENKDENFYGEFSPLFLELSTIDRVYDKVRNYLTQKPYSKEKIKLNFENPQLLGGWDKNKEKDYRTVLLEKDEKYYLAVMDKSNNKAFEKIPESSAEDCYKKMEYKLLPGPNKMLPKVFFASSNADLFAPDKRVLSIRAKESFKKGKTFDVDDMRYFIDFFKKSIDKHPDWSQFGFKFSPTDIYKDISEFYREVAEQGYFIKFKSVPVSYIDSLIDNGQLYLFQIYNKDFSEHSHGTPNMHTLYFRMLFDEKNLDNVVFKLNGEAEMFYREASLKLTETTVHPANQPIENKNPDNAKKESTFAYDMVKDKRFTKRQYSFHLPITMNFKATGSGNINNAVKLAVKDNSDNYVIGIDRGERNLLYISVINNKGEIVEQMSLNEIISDNGHKVNYHNLLDRKEKKRDEARKSWSSIENIKELKEGYLSQVIHKICELVVKYDAVIAMEDLNSGFKNSRFKVEKQVYQKFENMLISKLNFLADKKADADTVGGLLNAYQLTNKVDGVNKFTQNGIIFYIPAWNTSKIDPVTGFVDLLHPRYTSVDESHKFFGLFDAVRYNPSEDMFEFDIDYSKFPKASADFRNKWTVCTNGERIRTFRNSEKNGEWDNEVINLTSKFKALFDEFGVDYNGDIKASILKISNKDFLVRLTSLLALTLQMRNSITGSTNPEDDYLISPVKGKDGTFYDSRNYSGANAVLPTDADANGAYNIARKGLMLIDRIKTDENIDKVKFAISNAQWLEYIQA